MKKNYFLAIAFLFSAQLLASNFGSLSYGYAINIAGKQRMLSQRITKTALLKANQLGSENLTTDLEASISLFTTNYHTLLRNSENANKRFEILLKEELKAWNDFLGDVRAFNGEGLTSLLNKSEILLGVCQKFVLELEAEATFSTEDFGSKEESILQNSTINIAGQQRVLSQKYSVYYLAGILYGMESIYDSKLIALRKQQRDDLSFLIFNSLNNEKIEEQFMEVTMLFELLDKYQDLPSNISTLKIVSFCDRITRIYDDITNNYTKLYLELNSKNKENFSALTSTNK